MHNDSVSAQNRQAPAKPTQKSEQPPHRVGLGLERRLQNKQVIAAIAGVCSTQAFGMSVVGWMTVLKLNEVKSEADGH